MLDLDMPIVGRSAGRVEDAPLLTGSARFVADIAARAGAGTLWARVVRSEMAHGRLDAVDVSQAARRPGVIAVVTGRDVPTVDVPLRIGETPGALRALQPVIARDVVRYVGEPVAVVVATDPYLAEDAAEDVVVDVAPLPPVLDVSAAGEAAVVDSLHAVHGGDVAALFAGAEKVVAGRLRVHRHTAVPLECRGLHAAIDPTDGRLTVWGPAKVKHFNRDALAHMLGMPPSRIRFVEPEVGGSFGVRGEFYPEDFLIPWLALRLQRAVAWVEDRREHLVATNHSREQDTEIEIAANGEGQLLAFRSRCLLDLGAYVRTNGMMLARMSLNHIAGPYRWGGYEADVRVIATNKTPAGTFRGPGQYEPTFVRERMLDRLATELAMDPAELRRRNLVRREEMPYVVDQGADADTLVYDETDYLAAWDALMVDLNYDELREDVRRRRAAGERVGLGLSAFVEQGRFGPFEHARVVCEGNGRFAVHVGVASVGQGVRTALGQIAADALRVPLDHVRVTHHDTDVVPEGLGAFGSRTTTLGGNAVLGAVRDLEHRARTVASARLTVDPRDLEIAAGRIAPIDRPDDALDLASLGVEGSHRYESPGTGVAMGANAVVAELDVATGGVRVRRCSLAYDVGRAVNPAMVMGQLVGGAAQGIGGAVLEELAYDAAGQPLAVSFMDYLLPTAADVPPLSAIVLELGEPTAPNPLALHGCGEGGIVGVGAAVANAVADATGADVTELPLKPATVAELLARATRENPRARRGIHP